MTTIRTASVIFAAAIALAGCKIPGLHGGSKAPTGQVVATVNGDEITQRELQVEVGEMNFPDAKTRKMAEQQALQQIIARRLIAGQAREEKLDKTPDYSILKDRAADALLVSLMEKKLGGSMPTPTEDEAQRFITEHPEQFAQRKIWVVDTIRFVPFTDEKLLKGMAPLRAMPDIEAYLSSNHIAFTRSTADLDALELDPSVVDQIIKLPPGEIFVVPSGGALSANQIRETRIVPFSGDAATKYAVSALKYMRTKEAGMRRVGALLSKAAPTIRYNPAYKLATPAPAPAPARQ